MPSHVIFLISVKVWKNGKLRRPSLENNSINIPTLADSLNIHALYDKTFIYVRNVYKYSLFEMATRSFCKPGYKNPPQTKGYIL